MKTLKLGKLLRILVIFTILCGAIGGALSPGAAYAQGTWTQMTIPNPEKSLRGVWGSGPNDVFAVGVQVVSGVYAGVIVHYNGTAWTTTTIAPPVDHIYTDLQGVWGSGPNDVWAVGSSTYKSGFDQHGDGMIVHYDGTAWSTPLIIDWKTLQGVWGSGPSDVFAVGGGAILHYNGTAWSTMTGVSSDYLHGVWGSGPSDVYAVGSELIILHYDGTAWSLSYNRTTGLWNEVNGVWGSGPNDVYAVGQEGIILHYDGTAWSTMTSGTSNTLNGVWGTSSTGDVFAVGDKYTILHYTVSLSSDATLSNLALSSGALTPVFAPGTTSYAASVVNSVASINVTATVSESHATVTVNGQAVSSGQPSPAINLNVGANTITIVVTAQDGTTTRTYTVTVTRQSAVPNDATLGSLTLSSGTLTPGFAPGTTSYTASVDNPVTSITVTPTVNQSHATVTVNGQAVTSGQASQAINLNVGDNTVTIVVTAQDGTTTRTYTVTVTRQLPLATYTLTMAQEGWGGYTNPGPGPHAYPAGSVVTISATPWYEAFWYLVRWDGDVALPFNTVTTVTMDGDKTVTAHFVYSPPPPCAVATVHSPVELRVYDSQNQVTGLVNGIVKEEIPNSSYNSTSATVVINPATDSYYYQVAGTGAGTYGLEVVYSIGGQTTSFNAISIPILSGAIHQYTIDWDALSQGNPGVTVQTDLNGDGVFEKSFTSDGTLTHDEYVLQTDTTPPVTTASLSPLSNANGWNNTNVTANLTATDTGSGVKEIHYAINGGTETIVPGASALFNITSENVTTVTYFAKDNAGNTETPKSVTVKIDKTKPTINVSAPQAKEYLASENITLDFTATDHLSGLSSIHATINGQSVVNGQKINLSVMDGNYILDVQANDKAGNMDTKQVTFVVKNSLGFLRPIEYRWGAPSPGYSRANWPIFESWMNVRMENKGAADAFNVKATITKVPANVIIVNGNVTLGNIPKGASAWSSDTFRIKTDMSKPSDPKEGIYWKVEYDDALGTHHVIENVPQFPPK